MKRSGPIARKTPIRAYTPIRKKRLGKRRRDFEPTNPYIVNARKARLREVVGCIACNLEGYGVQACEFHHPRVGTGGGQKASDMDTIPLCRNHHEGDDHPRTPSIHRDKLAFIARYGTERELLEKVNLLIAKHE